MIQNNYDAATLTLNTKWLETAVRKILNKPAGNLAQEDFNKIKYLKISNNDRYPLELSLESPPCPFIDVSSGDEWECCCIGKENLVNCSDILPRNFSEKFGLFKYSIEQIDISKQYIQYIHMFDDVDWIDDAEVLISDLIKFKNLEILRFNSIPLDDSKFLQEFKNLKVLEMADSGKPNANVLKQLINLEQMCVW